LLVVLSGCFSLLGALLGGSGSSGSGSQTAPAPAPVRETQAEKFARLINEGNEKMQAFDGSFDASIEAVWQPQEIRGLDEITVDQVSEPGKPYWFKIRAIYKGYDAEAGSALLQDLGEVQSSTLDDALGAFFGGDTKIHSTSYFGNPMPTFPAEANTVATFYLVATRFTEDQYGDSISAQFGLWIAVVRNVEKPMFDPSKFIVANALHFITVVDAHVPTQQDAMMSMLGYGSMNASASIFDPAVYPASDLLDARIAMDKKRYGYDITFPTVRVKYVSEVVFKGQSGTTITVSTDDGVATEQMNFGGRASGIENGQRIRVYYTIAKDPLEEWEVQALERL
jgi:hypothetical protein